MRKREFRGQALLGRRCRTASLLRPVCWAWWRRAQRPFRRCLAVLSFAAAEQRRARRAKLPRTAEGYLACLISPPRRGVSAAAPYMYIHIGSDLAVARMQVPATERCRSSGVELVCRNCCPGTQIGEDPTCASLGSRRCPPGWRQSQCLPLINEF